MAKTLRQFTSDGIQVLYDVSFDLGFIDRSHVFVYVGDDHTDQLAYTWVTDSQVQLTTAAPTNDVINIRRIVAVVPLVDYNSTGLITELSLDTSNRQSAMLHEQRMDGFDIGDIREPQDMRGNIIKGLPDAVEDDEAVNLGQMLRLLLQSGIAGVLPLHFPRVIGTGTQTVYPTPITDQANDDAYFVRLDGVMQRVVLDYNVDDNGDVIFVEAPPVGVAVDITYFQPQSVTIDNPHEGTRILPTGARVARTLAERFADITYVSDYGAIQGQDAYAAVQAALDTGTTIDLAGMAWLCGTPLVLPTGKHVVIQNGTLDMASVPTDLVDLISQQGVGYTATTTLTANTAYSATTITVVDGSAYSVRDVVQITSTGVWATGGVTASEFAVVESVVGNTIGIKGGVLGTYRTADGALLRKVDTTTGAVFKNVTLLGNPTVNQNGIRLTNCARSGYQDIHIANCARTSMALSNCVYLTGSGSALFEFSNMEGLGYGLSVTGSQWCTFGDIVGNDCRHVTVGGDSSGSEALNRWITFGNTVGNGCRDAIIDTHGGACDVAYGNVSGTLRTGNGSDDGITMEGARITVGDVSISNVERYGININFTGMGDTGRLAFVNLGNVVIDGKGGDDYALLIENSASDTNAKLDSVVVGSLTAATDRGVYIAANSGDIGYVDLNLNIETETDTSVEVRSVATSRVETVAVRGKILHKSASTSHYVIGGYGTLWADAHGGEVATDILVNGLVATATNPVTNGIRSDACDTAVVNSKILGTFANGITRGTVRFNDAQSLSIAHPNNPSSVAAGGTRTNTVAVPELNFGDHIAASWDEDMQGLRLRVWQSAAQEVTYQFVNDTAGAIDLGQGNLLLAINKGKF